MKTVLIDSSFYIGLVYPEDSNHNRANALVAKLSPSVYIQVTTEDFLKETLTTISQRAGKAASIDFYEALITNTKVVSITPGQFQKGLELFLEPKRNKDISLIDCIGTVVYGEIEADAIVTFDKHFKSLKLHVIP